MAKKHRIRNFETSFCGEGKRRPRKAPGQGESCSRRSARSDPMGRAHLPNPMLFRHSELHPLSNRLCHGLVSIGLHDAGRPFGESAPFMRRPPVQPDGKRVGSKGCVHGACQWWFSSGRFGPNSSKRPASFSCSNAVRHSSRLPIRSSIATTTPSNAHVAIPIRSKNAS